MRRRWGTEPITACLWPQHSAPLVSSMAISARARFTRSKEAAKAASAGGALQTAAVLGTLSLLLWSLILIISLKYAILIMRADNRGEGGIVALLALLNARDAPAKLARLPAGGRPDRSGPSLRRRRHHACHLGSERGGGFEG